MTGETGEEENIYKFKNRIYYKEEYNDTLFCLNENFGMIPKYTFRMDKFKQPLSERAEVRLDNESKYIFVILCFSN
jgi:hypothetical protein